MKYKFKVGDRIIFTTIDPVVDPDSEIKFIGRKGKIVRIHTFGPTRYPYEIRWDHVVYPNYYVAEYQIKKIYSVNVQKLLRKYSIKD